MDIRVIGLGNVLMGDDGFGPFVIHTLESQYAFPPSVTLTDAGTPGLDLTPFVADADVVIFIDTVSATAAPGTLHVYPREELLRHLPQPRLSPHDPGLKETILTLDFAGRAPASVTLVGVVPEETAPGPGLSDAVRAAVPAAIDAILREVLRHRVPVTRRRAVGPPDIWWEAAPTAGAR